nr:hypothetical protein Iba_chr14cCG3590 [Ipomoea batatas]GME03179.1 hypothetical protein Iba_scaffold569CG0030 [Ipomoea batatas]
MLRRREGNAAGEGKRRCSRCLQSLFRSPKLVEKRLQLLRIQFLRHEDSMVADQKSIRPTSSTVFLTARRRSKLRLRGRWRAGSPSYRSRDEDRSVHAGSASLERDEYGLGFFPEEG